MNEWDEDKLIDSIAEAVLDEEISEEEAIELLEKI